MKAIIQKEGKIRMRTWKSVGMVTAYIGLLGAIVVLMLYASIYSGGRLVNFGEQSKNIFIALTVAQVLMISFIVPILTSGSISLEREKQTLDILLSTSLRPIQIVVGKLITSISQVLLLLVASLPIFSFLYLFGRVPITLILNLLVFYVVISIFFGSIGVFFSTIFKKTLPAIVLTYIVMIALTGGTIFGLAIYAEITGAYNTITQGATPWILYFNPGISFWTVLCEQFGDFAFVGEFVGDFTKFKYISEGIFLGLSVVILFITAKILNPLKKRR